MARKIHTTWDPIITVTEFRYFSPSDLLAGNLPSGQIVLEILTAHIGNYMKKGGLRQIVLQLKQRPILTKTHFDSELTVKSPSLYNTNILSIFCADTKVSLPQPTTILLSRKADS